MFGAGKSRFSVYTGYILYFDFRMNDMKERKNHRAFFAVLVLCCLLCGCSGGGADEGAEAEDLTFRFGVDFSLETLDSHRDSSNNVRALSDPMHGFLVWWDTENENLEGDLARDWTWANDMELLVFLKRSHYFSNGRGVTADDVVYTFERVLDPEWGSLRYSVFAEVISSVTAQDLYTVRFKLKRPDAIFLSRLTQVPNLCEESIDTLGYAPVGCGPFSFVSWDKSGDLVMKRSPYYPQTGTRYANYSSLIVRSYENREDLYDAFVDGEIDSMQIDPTELLSVTADTDAYIQGGLGTSYYLAGNQDHELLSTWGVMQAIKYAVDREEIVNLALYGFGNQVLAPLSLDSPHYPHEQEYERDLDLAREWLKVAGYPNGFSVELTVSDQLRMPQLANLLSAQLGEVGIRVKVRVVSVEAFADLWRTGDFELVLYNTAIAREPAEKYRQWVSRNQTNYISYRNVMFDHLYEVGSTTMDPTAQKYYFDWLQKTFLRDAVVQYLVNHHIFYAVHQNWTGLESHFMITDFTSVRPTGRGGA